MKPFSSVIYTGQVVHQRLTPKPHAFCYKVFALALDLDEIAQAADRLRLLGYNRRALVSFHDGDHGRGDATPIAAHIRTILAEAGLQRAGTRVVLVCYPRLLGFVFNPLSAYFCYDGDDRLGAIIYEVSNTFGERTSYVIPTDDGDGRLVRQSCAKRMYVSPFTNRDGRYDFHVSPPNASVLIGVTLRDADGPVLKTHFRGTRLPLTDQTLARMVAQHPLMTLKVMAGIHLQAARLWWKGVPIVPRHTSPSYSVTVISPSERGTAHA